MKLFAATIATETNTFSPLPTSLESFREAVFYRPGEHPNDAPRMCTAPLFVARSRATRGDFVLIEGSCFAASPAGITSKQAYEQLREEVLAQVKNALPLDGVLLGLHGAMVAHGYDDVEGDLIAQVRSIVGDACVIGVEHDPHCHMTIKRLQHCDVMICYKEFPHTDVADRAEELIDIVIRTINGEVQPVMSMFDCRQIGSYPTTLPLMRAFVERMKSFEGRDGILSVSAIHCFPYGDVEDLGSRLLVVADGSKAKADALATKLGLELVAMRGKTTPEFLSVQNGVDKAIAIGEGPVVIADPADNAGGGAPSDNTNLLRTLIEKKVVSACIGPIWDPIAVRLCFDAGVGARIPLRLGGKIGPDSDTPIDASVEVIATIEDCWQSFGPTQVPLGDCVCVRIDSIDIIIITKRTQALGLELFRNLGVEPTERHLVCVKSTNHFMAAFGPIASEVIYVDSNGPLRRDYRSIPYKKVRRPIWPLDDHVEPKLVF